MIGELAPLRPDVSVDRGECVVAEDASGWADAEPQYLRRALSNLITNAMRHAERQVRVSFTINGQTARLDVDDDGPGVPEADWERSSRHSCVWTTAAPVRRAGTGWACPSCDASSTGMAAVPRSGTASSVAHVSVWSGRGSTWIELTFPQLRQGGLQPVGSVARTGGLKPTLRECYVVPAPQSPSTNPAFIQRQLFLAKSSTSITLRRASSAMRSCSASAGSRAPAVSAASIGCSPGNGRSVPPFIALASFRRTLAGGQGVEGMLQRAQRLLGVLRAIHAVEDTLQRRIALGAAEQSGDFGIQRVGRPLVPCTEGEHQGMQQVPENAVGEVGQHFLQRAFGFLQAVLQRPAQQRLCSAGWPRSWNCLSAAEAR